uniref:Uncharacterized protein n=1 Tax=Myotis myotis TaxID=51298 RepID=A0A7J7SR13_MYOMY|nr:hypothetical protein mMyoMyo1_009274 [Myotis myotis]
MHRKTREEGAPFLAGPGNSTFGCGLCCCWGTVGPKSGLPLVYHTPAFVFHTLYDSNFAELPLALRDPSGDVGEPASARSPQARPRDPPARGTHSLCRHQGGSVDDWLQDVSSSSRPGPPPPTSHLLTNFLSVCMNLCTGSLVLIDFREEWRGRER